MSEKFKNVKVESDTKVLSKEEVKLGEFDALYEEWSWEGIKAESLIFLTADVGELSEKALIDLVKSSPKFQGEGEITVKVSDPGYTFVNFNFR